MALPNIFSRRLRQQESAGTPEVYIYDALPTRLRVQVTQIWVEAFGLHTHGHAGHEFIKETLRLLRKEKGVYYLTGNDYEGPQVELFNWFLNEPKIELCLDAVEINCRFLEAIRDRGSEAAYYAQSTPDEAIEELNARFLEAGVGYQYESGAVVRVDSQLVHAEVVKPLLVLLHEADYVAANGEFLEAHRLYRAGDYEKSLTECCKAFESALKVIIHKQGWTVAPNATAKGLLDVIFALGLVPEFLQGGISSLRALLEGSIATLRNKSGGHGAGTTPRTVSRHLAGFQLHQTASTMLFLIDAEKALP